MFPEARFAKPAPRAQLPKDSLKILMVVFATTLFTDFASRPGIKAARVRTPRMLIDLM